ncbi:MAG: BamA/TamA family outer membrane protein [Calditrichaeota bacterium]|nr:BamA/TamA family outer membrane protein [Calditrichota bacterium]
MTYCKRNAGLTFSLILFFIFLATAPSAWGQFKIEKIETATQSLFEGEKGKIDVTPALRYNRVQGFVVGADATIALSSSKKIDLLGHISYGFKDEVRYIGGLQKSFFEFSPLTIGIRYQNVVASQDDWFISYNENSAAALFLKEDFMDYFVKKGLLGFIDQKIAEKHTIRLEVEQSRLEPIEKNTNWALFGKNKNFRENPLVKEEDVTSYRLVGALDWRDNPLMPMSGWYIEGKGELTKGDFFDTKGIFLTIKKYMLLFSNHSLRFKTMIGSRSGCKPDANYYTMDMGGIGALVGYKDKEFKNGNRFFYATAHYLFNNTLLGKLPLGFIPFYDQLSLGIFAESGWLDFDFADENVFSGFKSMTFADMKSDVGVSLYLTEGLARIDFAKRTDRGKDAWRVTFRIMNRF